MRFEALSLYRCPSCFSEDLELKAGLVFSFSNFDEIDLFTGKKGNEVEFVKRGLIVCKQCSNGYQIEDFIPNFRLDNAVLIDETSSAQTVVENSVLPEDNDLQMQLKQLIKDALPLDRAVGVVAQKNVEHDIEYRLKHARKDKYVRLFTSYLANESLADKAVLEIGIGQGGFSSSVKELLKPKRIIGLDYEFSWAKIAKKRDFSMEVVVADGRNMPFRSDIFDFVYSAYTLEHIPDFESVISETSRISTQAFFIFGPSRFSPYDFHFEKSPLIPLLPKKLAVRMAYYWKVKRAGYDYTFEEINAEYETMNYISPRHFERVAKESGFEVYSLFARFLSYSFGESYQYHPIMKLFKVFRFIFIPFMRMMEILRIHPIMVYFLDSTKNKS